MSRTPTASPTRRYRGERYWEAEQPREADCGWVRLRYFEQAGKLQVQHLWRDKAGQLRPGRVVTLDAEALALAPEARAILTDFLAAAQ